MAEAQKQKEHVCRGAETLESGFECGHSVDRERGEDGVTAGE